MSYDIHGTWDGGSKWTSPIVQPHTNLTEISQGLNLLWRNNIQPYKVVLGMAFYGRSFTLQSPACSSVDCLFSGGGNAGTCTGTVGILSDAEIRTIINMTGVTPTLDKTAGVKWITWNSDQWVSYDDADTFIIKREFANGLCLGGVMVWALDQDDITSSTSAIALYQARTSKIASKVSSLSVKALAGARSQAVSAYLSAYWTTCASYSSCADGYTPLTYASGRIMEADVDITEDDGRTCGYGGWQRAFCMSANAQTTGCRWYGTPKTCNTLCPAGYLALAYNSHPDGERTILAFAVYCCQSVWATPLSQNFCSEDSIQGDIVIHKVLGGGSLGTSKRSAIAARGFGAGSGGKGIGISNYCFNPYPTQLDTSQIDAPGDIGGYFNNVGNLVQANVPDIGDTQETPDPVSELTDTTISTEYSTSTVTCSGSIYPQACLHYRSVIATNPDMGELTCPPVSGSGRPAVTAWSSQHKPVWLTSWIKPFTKTRGASSGHYDSCQRDEYPPFVFLQGLPGAYIRFLAGSQNGGAGQGFKGICKFPPKSATARVVPQGVFIRNGVYINYFSEYRTTTFGVMDYQFDGEVPNYDDAGLGQNECNPAILTIDNGFPLLTDDPWYTRNNYRNAMANNAAAYRDAPAPELTRGLTNWGELYAAAWAAIDSDPDLAPPAKAKRWLDEQGMTLDDATPDKIFISDGNSTRRPTEKELFELFGFWKCESGGCDQELASLGVTLVVQEPVLLPEQVVTDSAPPPAEATLKPASGAGSLRGSVPVSIADSDSPRSAEATPMVTAPALPNGRFVRSSRDGNK